MDTSATNGMSFGLAIEAAKKGKKIARSGWNGKNQYVELATNISYVGADGSVVNTEHNAIGNKALAFVDLWIEQFKEAGVSPQNVEVLSPVLLDLVFYAIQKLLAADKAGLGDGLDLSA